MVRLIDEAMNALAVGGRVAQATSRAKYEGEVAQREQELQALIEPVRNNLRQIVLEAAKRGENDIVLFELSNFDTAGPTPPGAFPCLRCDTLKEFCKFLTSEGLTVTAPYTGKESKRQLIISVNGRYKPQDSTFARVNQ